MRWQTIAGFVLVIMGLGIIALGIRLRFQPRFARMPHVIAWLVGSMDVLIGIGSLSEQRPPLFGISISTAEAIGVGAIGIMVIDAVALCLFLITYNPTLPAVVGIALKLREWIFRDSLPEQSFAGDSDSTTDGETSSHA